MTAGLGLMNIIGIDEVGLGPIAGPVVVAAVVFPEELVVDGVGDSKALKPHQRVNVIHAIHEHSLHWVIAQSGVEFIDEHGINQCLRGCMVSCAMCCLERFPDAHVVVDGKTKLPHPVPTAQQTAMPKADAKVQAVGAASIIAKVWRDQLIAGMAAAYPAYGFETHKGYPTVVHLAQLKKHGPCPEHRRSYAPVKRAIRGA